MADVSIVIPTRDRWPVLEARGLRAALSQEGVDVEVLVVDDGSRDPVPSGLAGLGDPRVRLLRNDVPRGVSAARNRGIEAARSPWIAFLDDDDLWSPRKLEIQLHMGRIAGASLVYAGVVVVNSGYEPLFIDRPAPTCLDDLLERNTIPAGSSNVLVRGDEVRAIGGFDENLTYVADWDLWIRLAAKGSLTACPDLLVGYVRDGGGMRFGGKRGVDEMRYFVEKHRSHGLRADPARFLRWIAAEQRLAGNRVGATSTYLRSGIAFRKPRHLRHAASTIFGPRAGSVGTGSAGGRPGTPTEIDWLRLYG